MVDEGAEVTPHCTSYSPYQGVAQLLSPPFNVARPRFSPERGENGCDPPSPYDHDGRINDRLGRGLRRQTDERGVEGRVPLWSYKLPGTQGCLPGFEVFSPRSRGVSYHSQNGQYMAVVSHINRQGGSRSRTLDRLARHLLLWSQDKFLSLRAVHVPGILNLAADFLSRQNQPMNWRDSIWVQTSVMQWAFPMRSTQRLVPYSENKGYASNPRCSFDMSINL